MRIDDPALRQALLAALGDRESLRILSATASAPRSASDLIREEGLPLSSVYRRLRELQTEGLLGIAKTVRRSDGKIYQMYKATFSEVTVKFQGKELVVEATPNQEILDKAFRLFHSLEQD